MKLIIAEKPSVAESIAKALDKNYKKNYGYIQVKDDLNITWAIGHLFGLKDPKDYDSEKYKKWTLENLPIYFPNWEIKPIEDKKNQIEIIKKLLKESSEVINCGDPDDEGQLLIDEILWYFKYKGKVKRLLINDENEDSIRKAYQKIEDNKKYENLGKSAHARRIADILVGYNMTQYFTLKNNSGVLNIGRVQTPLLEMIVNRDLLIESHTKQKHYKLKFNLEVQKTPSKKDVEEFEKHRKIMLKALKNKEKLDTYFEKCEDLAEKIKLKTISFDFIPEKDSPLLVEGLILNKDTLELIREHYKGVETTIAVHKTIVSESPPLLFNLAKLQSYCSKKWGYSPDKTLEITQGLREKHKAITYNRSDSQYLNDEYYENKDELIKYISKNLNVKIDYDPGVKPKCFNSAYVTAHHGIIPTMTEQDLNKFSAEEKNVYEIIAKYYLIQFLDDCVKEKILIEGLLENEITKDKIRTTQTKTIELGWKAFLKVEDEEEEKEENKVDLSYLEQGLYNATIVNSGIAELETKPKSRYTYDTILQDMTSIAKYCEDPEIKRILIEKDAHKEGENGSIGTPATRSSILKNLVKNGFIEEKKKQIISTEKGRSFIKILPNELKKVDMTAKWYLIQEQIKEGVATEQKLIDSTLQLVDVIMNKTFEKVDYEAPKKEAKKEEKEVIGKCICSGEIVETPKAYTCIKCSKALFKENKFYGEIKKAMAKKLLAGKEVLIKQIDGKFGKYDATVKAEFGEKYITIKSIKK